MRLFSRLSSASETAWTFSLPRPDFVAGSYQRRTFLSPPNHLGEDSAHDHHETVHAIADGFVRDAGSATGYGRVVVVEHRLPDGSHVCSIYGHLCGHDPLVREGSRVKRGDVVGTIGDRRENGDGLEHLHLGIRKGRYDGYFCGYARWPYCTPKHYHPPTEFIRARSGTLALSSAIQSFPVAPGSRDLAFKACVTNGFFYGGIFELRLRALAGDEVLFTTEAHAQKLAPGAAASLLFPTPVSDGRRPRAVLEVRPPGTESWTPVEARP